MREGIIVTVCIGFVLLLFLNRDKNTPEKQGHFQLDFIPYEVGSSPAPATYHRIEYWDRQIEKARMEKDTLKVEQALIEKDLVKKSIEKALGRPIINSDSLIN